MGCRCNRETERGHLCHGQGYTCPNPGKLRIYNAEPVALAGMQMKVQAQQTIACDVCWAAYIGFDGSARKPLLSSAATSAKSSKR